MVALDGGGHHANAVASLSFALCQLCEASNCSPLRYNDGADKQDKQPCGRALAQSRRPRHAIPMASTLFSSRAKSYFIAACCNSSSTTACYSNPISARRSTMNGCRGALGILPRRHFIHASRLSKLKLLHTQRRSRRSPSTVHIETTGRNVGKLFRHLTKPKKLSAPCLARSLQRVGLPCCPGNGTGQRCRSA